MTPNSLIKFLDHSKKSLELEPNFALGYLNRGNVKFYLKDHNGAISDSNKVIEIEPNNAMAYYNRALSKATLGDKNEACEDARKAKELGYNADKLIEFLCD